jgi:predicted SnoaL-like aldol condensation-catalyzing enzyme
MDILRLDAIGKVLEHWDVLLMSPETTTNDSCMF